MDRVTVYPAAVPLDSDILSPQRNAMIAIGYALRAAFGTGTYADGLACSPTVPSSMQVTVGVGSLITMSTIDSSNYGTLAADLDPLVKMGINPFGSTTFTLTAPGTSGQTINYLIEAQLLETDGLPVALPYYNASNPSQPFTGPNNNQALQNTVRTQRVGLQLKAGAAANTGTQQTPGVDAGWVGLYTISVNFAQTTINAVSISVYPSAPFIAGKIPTLAPLDSPVFTNIPRAPTAAAGTTTTQLATTAFVQQHSGFANASTFGPGGTVTLAGGNSTSFTVPANVFRMRMRVWGGGGGGGGSINSASAAIGGSAGGYAEGIYTVTPGQVLNVTVGVAGAAGAALGGNGGNGGASLVTGFLQATGGQGSGGSSGGIQTVGTGAAGVGSGGTLWNLPGLPGQVGFITGNTSLLSGGGGGSSPGFTALTGVIAAPGANASMPGCGGGGASAAAAGGSGATGYVLLEW